MTPGDVDPSVSSCAGPLSYEQLSAAYEECREEFVHRARGIIREEAEDAVQEGFKNALVKRHTYRGVSPLKNWLWTIVKHAAYNLLEGRGVELARRAPSAVEVFASVVAEEEKKEDFNLLQEVLPSLSETDRTIVDLCLLRGLTLRQAADTLDVVEGTLRYRIKKILPKLRKMITTLREGGRE